MKNLNAWWNAAIHGSLSLISPVIQLAFPAAALMLWGRPYLFHQLGVNYVIHQRDFAEKYWLSMPMSATNHLQRSSLLFPSPFRWLFHKTTCIVYAFCGVLFGLCSLTNLTVLSCVCWLKVCCPNYGKTTSLCALIHNYMFKKYHQQHKIYRFYIKSVVDIHLLVLIS